MGEWVDTNGDNKHDVTGQSFAQWSADPANASTDSGEGYGTPGYVLIAPPTRKVTGRPGSPSIVLGEQPAVSKTQAKTQFRGGLLTYNESTWKIADWMYSSGLLSADPRKSQSGFNQAVSIYNKAVDYAADAYAVGDVNRTVMDFLSFTPGSGRSGAGGGGTSVSKQIQNYTPEQARQKAIDAYKAILNRAPSAQEISEFTTGLINSAKNAPSIQKVSAGRGGTVQETTQGFDEKTWTLGFMAGKIPSEGDLAGAAGVAQDVLQSLSQNYGIKLSTPLAFELVRDMVQGKMDENGAEQVFKEQAKSLFPHLSDKIDAGLSPRKIADPYISNTMRILEKTELEADMFNPYVKEALTYKDATGNYALPTADEHARLLRSKDEWLNTRNGKETMMSAADNILKQMGFE